MAVLGPPGGVGLDGLPVLLPSAPGELMGEEGLGELILRDCWRGGFELRGFAWVFEGECVLCS